MKVLSVNVGLPRKVLFNRQIVTTAIFKDPVKGPIMLRKLNLDGDKQADLTVHGGVDKAVYSYPAEHYDYWRKQFPNMDLVWGMFGENFRPCKVKISNHCYDDKQIDSAISVCVAIYIYFFYKENNHRNFQFYL